MIGDAKARVRALDPRHSFCVTAPAGSGKTELLTQRLLALLSRVDQPQQVLAITFTRKAAAEMRTRLLEKLQQAEQDEPVDDAHEQVTRELAKEVLARARDRQWELVPGSFNLRTIDSLCADITRQMPITSALGGSVDVTQQSDPLFSQAVDQLLEQTDSQDATGAALRALLLHFDNDWGRLKELLVALLNRRADWAGRLGMHHAPEDAERQLIETVTALCESVLATLASDLGEHAKILFDLFKHSCDRLGVPHRDLSYRDDYCYQVDDVPAWQQALSLLITKKGEWRKVWNKNQGFPPEDTSQKQQLAELVAALSSESVSRLELFEECLRLPHTSEGDPSWALVLHLSHLLPVLQAQLLLVFQQEGCVDYSHIALAAEQALGAEDDPTDLSLRFDYQLQHILVDEFQDTSDQQYRLLTRLTRGWAEHNRSGLAPRTLFLVGDGMQSIYGFRYANVGIFLQARNQGLNGLQLEPLELRSNFRSTQGVVDWVNRVFAKILPTTDDPSRGQVRHVRAEATRPAGESPAVGVHVIEDEEGLNEAAFVVERLMSLRTQEPESTIAILVRARSHALPIIEALEHAGIDYMARDFDLLKYRPAIRDLLSLCRWLANPADEVAAVSLLRGPWCGLSLDTIEALVRSSGPAPFSLRASLRQWLKKREEAIPEPHGEEEYQRAQHLLTALSWSLAHRDRMGLAVWVEQSWQRLGADLALNDAERSEARRFLDLLAEAESAGAGLDLSRINQHLNTLYAEQAAEHSSLEIMTLHKAKGLQFDHVFMPMMHKTIGGQGRDLLRWHWLSSGSVDGLLIAANDRRSPEEPSLYNYLNWLQRKKDAAELRRLVYVGVTRARSSVCISAGHNPTQDWPHWPSSGTGLGVLREAVSEEVIFHPDDVKHPMVPEQESAQEGFCRLPLEALPLERVPEPTIVSQGRTRAGDPESVTPGGRQIDKSVLYREGNRVDRAVGTSTHRALELLSHRSMLPEELDQPLLAAIELSLRSSGLEGTTLLDAQEKVNALIRRTLKDERGRWLLKKRPCADSELILDTMAAEGMESRVVDRTFVDDDTGIRWVVDYKTSQPMAGESKEQFLKRELTHYRDQVMHYVELLTQLDQSAVEVRGGLYFPAHSIWQPLT